MMATKNRHIIILLLLLVSNLSFSQNKNLDNIEMYYDQGTYSKVIKKSKKLLKTDAYKGNSTLLLFHALAEYQLSKTSKRYSDKKAFADYLSVIKKDETGILRLKYNIYIYEMQLGLVNDIRRLKTNGYDITATEKYKKYQELFGEGVSFEEIIRSKPIIEDEIATNTTTSGKRESVIDYAKKQLGTPYLYGGNTKKGFDCSGFTQYVLAHNGYTLPRTAQAQGDNYVKIKRSEATKGDLVFFGSSKKNISHVGIISSEKGKPLTMIHASSSKGIMISTIENDTYWTPKILFFARIIKD